MHCAAQNDMATIFRVWEWETNLCNWSSVGFTVMEGKDRTNSMDIY